MIDLRIGSELIRIKLSAWRPLLKLLAQRPSKGLYPVEKQDQGLRKEILLLTVNKLS